MIGYLQGRVRHGTVVTDGGVGYLVHTPEPLEEGSHVELEVITVVREGSIDLYGFATLDEQALFSALTKVSGVGPSSALSLLRTLGAGGIVAAIGAGNAKELTRAPGIGAKAAATLLATVKLPAEVVARAGAQPSEPSRGGDEITSALEGLGFSGDAASAAVHSARAKQPSGDEETILALALAELRNAA